MANKVCCDETEVEKTKNMNDRDYLIDILASEKDITKNMCVALTEASNSTLHDELYDIFNTVEELQADTYEMAWNYGWYKLEEAEETKKSTTKTELETKMEELKN